MKARSALVALGFACALAMAAPGAAPAAFDSYLQLDGIDGESNNVEFQDAIEVFSFSLGGSRAASKPPSFSSLNIMKRADSASPVLMQAMATGQTIASAKLSLVKVGGDTNGAPFLRYCFTGVRVESVQWSGSAGADDTPTESLSLAYNTIVQAYQRTKDDGSLDSSVVFGGWDLVGKLQFGDQSC